MQTRFGSSIVITPACNTTNAVEDLEVYMVVGRNGVNEWRIKVTEKSAEDLVNEFLDKLDWMILVSTFRRP